MVQQTEVTPAVGSLKRGIVRLVEELDPRAFQSVESLDQAKVRA
jgi:hypothetical protein